MDNQNFDITNKKEDNNSKKDFYSALAKLITTENVYRTFDFFEKLLDYKKNVENQKNTTTKETQNLNLAGWKWRFSKDFCVVLIICILIFSLAYYDKIETSTTGTLVGSLIGYAVGKNYSNQNK